MTYDDLIKFLIEKAQSDGQASAALGKDWVLSLSVTRLRELLIKAENNPDGVAIIVMLGKQAVTNGNGNLPN